MATYWENSCSFGLRYVSWYKYLIVSLVFSHLGFWSGNLFLIAPFPDLCLLVPFDLLDRVSQKCSRYEKVHSFVNKTDISKIFYTEVVLIYLIHIMTYNLLADTSFTSDIITNL